MVARKRYPVKALYKTPKFRLIAAILIVGLLALITLELTGVTHVIRKQKPTSSTIPSTTPVTTSDKAGSQASKPDQPTSQQNSPTTDKTNAPASSNNEQLISPYGTFVSNHKSTLSGGTAEQSVCITTPGASCSITFTNSGGDTKILQAQTADNNGTVYWNWDVKTAG